MPSSIMKKFLDEENDSRQLTSEERSQISEELELYLQELSYSYLLKFYKTKIGIPKRDQRSSKILIRKLIESLGSLDVVWTVQDLKEIIHRVQVERSIKKPRGINIIKIGVPPEELDFEELKTTIDSLPGFEVVASSDNSRVGEENQNEQEEVEFRYWYQKTRKILTEDLEIQEISYRVYIPIKIVKLQYNNLTHVLAYIYSRTAADVGIAKRILTENLGISLIDTGLKNRTPSDANRKFNDFLIELEQKINQAQTTNNNSTVPPIWIEDVIISTRLAYGVLKDNNGQIMTYPNGQPINLYDNSKRISVKGKGADLYSYPVVKKYMDDNGKVIGVRGEFEYIEHEYKFSAGYTEGLKTVNHVKLSVKPKGRVLPGTQEYQLVKDILRNLVEKYFVFG